MRQNLFLIRRTFPLMCLLLLFAFSAREIMDPDFWWHLRTGQYIVQHHAVPYADIFSSTFAGKPWITHEWLSEAFMYGLYVIGGWSALILAFSAIITGALAVTYLRCQGKPFVAAMAVALAALTSFPAWGVRPQMITFLFVSLFLWLLDDDEPRHVRRLWWLVGLMVVWVNAHGAYALGLALIGFFLIAAAIQTRTDRTPGLVTRMKTLAWVLAACVAVIPLNPNGARLYLYPFETLHSSGITGYLNEWQSPNFHNSAFLPFAAMLLLTFAAVALSRERVRMRSVVLLAGASYAALNSVRHIPLFAIIAAPVLAECLAATPVCGRLNKQLESPRSSALHVVGLVGLAFVAFVGVVRISRVVANQEPWERIEFPASTVEFLKSRRPAGRIYNPYHWGGYLIWKMPEYPVFIDGRSDMYGDRFLAQYFEAARGNSDGRKLLNDYSIQTAITERSTPMAALLQNDQKWKVIFKDGQAIVFARRD